LPIIQAQMSASETLERAPLTLSPCKCGSINQFYSIDLTTAFVAFGTEDVFIVRVPRIGPLARALVSKNSENSASQSYEDFVVCNRLWNFDHGVEAFGCPSFPRRIGGRFTRRA
jgi:hypothetical protein